MTSGMALRMARFLVPLARSDRSERRRSISTEVRAANRPSVNSAIFGSIASGSRLMTDMTPSRTPERICEGHPEIALETHLHEKLIQRKVSLHVAVVEITPVLEDLLAGRVVQVVFEDYARFFQPPTPRLS